jgi:hypothetical protein
MSLNEIKRKAEEVNRISLNYHLTHAVFACNQMLRDIYKRERESELRGLNRALQKAYREEDLKEQKNILEKKRRIEQKVKYYIYVEYINDMPADENRVIKTERQLIVSLSGKLLEQARSEDGSFIKGGLNRLRQVTAHELGHALLHFEDMKPGALQGSKELDNAAETEAALFAKELLNLRHERNERIFKSGDY